VPVDWLSNCLLPCPASNEFQVADGAVSGVHGAFLDQLPDPCGCLDADAWQTRVTQLILTVSGSY